MNLGSCQASPILIGGRKVYVEEKKTMVQRCELPSECLFLDKIPEAFQKFEFIFGHNT